MTRATAKNRRRILCVFARYPDGYGIKHAHLFFRDVSSFMVPQGILTIAAYLPAAWEIRVVDENVSALRDEDIEWADAIFASGTHVQRTALSDIATRAHRAGKVAVVGGPSVSARPAYYPSFDLLHVGELGNGTDALVAHLDRSIDRPTRQIVFETSERLPLDDFPIPAYDQINFLNYYTATIQFSSGCPYTCEFCDIPELYGRKPRFKRAERIIAELEAILANAPVLAVYFVDDNFIGNKKAAKELLRALVEWQRRTGYRARFAAECTLNLALDREMLELMQQAYFTDIFFGIESPNEKTLRDIDKAQNVRMPILEAVRTINSYGIELSAGMIFGLDGEGAEAADAILDFIDDSKIPFVAPNILTALPKTPLWRRLEKSGRLRETERVEDLNLVYELGEEAVVAQWRRVVEAAYEPASIYRRFLHQVEHTYPNRKAVPWRRHAITKDTLRVVSYAVPSIFLRLGVAGRYRRHFWQLTRALFARGDFPQWVFLTTMGHHFIGFGDDVRRGELRHNIYGPRSAPPQERRSLLSAVRTVRRLTVVARADAS